MKRKPMNKASPAEGDEGASGFDHVAYVFGQCIALRIEPA